VADATAKVARGEERRQLILRSTMEVIAAEGLDAVTHRRVAEVADISFGSITYWFESRRLLIDATFRSYLDHLSSLIDDLEGELTVDSPDDLRDLLVALDTRLFQEPRLVLGGYELILAAARDAELAAAFVAWERLVLGRLAQALESLGAPRPFESGRTLLQLIRGNGLDRLTRPETGDDQLEHRLELVIRALLADQGP
jgi:DNA-binding transcriptional regulator YbjK